MRRGDGEMVVGLVGVDGQDDGGARFARPSLRGGGVDGTVRGRYQPLTTVLVAVCGGIVFDRYVGLPLMAWWAVVAGTLVVWLALRRRCLDAAAGLVLLVGVAGCGGAWFHSCWNLFAADELGRFAGVRPQPVCLEAVVLTEPARWNARSPSPMQMVSLGDRTRLEIRPVRIRDAVTVASLPKQETAGARWRRVSGQARLSVDGHLLGVHAGDRIEVFGELSAPSPACNPGGPDYASYARASRTMSLVDAAYPDCVRVVERPGWRGVGCWLDRVRAWGDALLRQHVGERQLPLANALLLGTRGEMAGERSDAYLETGTVHLLSVSGLHVGIIAATVAFVMYVLMVPRRLAAVILAGAVIAYVALTGGHAPAVRAAILVLAFCAGQLMGRGSLPLISLAAAGLVLLAINPVMLFSVGVQLSFLSVAAILWCVPRLPRARRSLDPLDRVVDEGRSWPARMGRRFLRVTGDVALVSAVVWLVTLPLVMARFHVLALVAVGLNVLIWVPVWASLSTGFALLAVGWIGWPLAAALGWCCDKSLWMTDWLVGAARAVPHSCLWVAGPPGWWLAGFYGGLGVLAAFPALRPRPRWCWALLIGWCAAGLVGPMVGGNRGALECTFLSVGHGCAVVVRLPDGRTMLYDAGKMAAPVSGMRTIAGCLWAKGVTHIDMVVLSHADADHYNALGDLIERFAVGTVCVSPVMFQQPSRSLAALERSIEAAGIPIKEISAGECLVDAEGCRIDVFHPPQGGVQGRDNANSIVLGLQYGGRRILLPGDLESPGLDTLVSEASWKCDVLLAPHHGSQWSRSPGTVPPKTHTAPALLPTAPRVITSGDGSL